MLKYSPSVIHYTVVWVFHDANIRMISQRQATMEVPTLSAIQASIFACSVLASSQDDFAHTVVSTYIACTVAVRVFTPLWSISILTSWEMAKRAGIFDLDEAVDYTSLNEEKFCWNSWIKHETRNRYIKFFGLQALLYWLIQCTELPTSYFVRMSQDQYSAEMPQVLHR